jgi:polyisoprenoid-binding protein YceI
MEKKKMNKFITLAFATFLVLAVSAQQYEPVDAKSEIKFGIKNFGLNTGGNFKGLEGVLIFDPANTASASFDISIDAASVNTDNNSRDNHLRKEDYFNVKSFPRISFKSDKITPSGSGFKVQGKLTIKGVSKEIQFPFRASAKEEGYLFEGNFKINRRDFNVGGNSMVLGDDVTVTLTVFGKRK